MLLDSYSAQRLAEQRMRDAIREVERERLIRLAQGPKKVRRWWLPAGLIRLLRGHRIPAGQRAGAWWSA